MTTFSVDTTTALRQAVDRAVHAPSVHNTQPWRFVLRRDELEIRLDRHRQLAVLDPSGRQLILSVGCAVFNARVSLAASGAHVRVDEFPSSTSTTEEIVAVFAADPASPVDADIAALEPFVYSRQTNRRQFTDESVPADLVDLLVDAAAQEGASLVPIVSDDDRMTLARLTQRADTEQITDPAYRAELRAWTSSEETRRDGVPARVVPHVDGSAADDIPIRDFDTHGRGWLPSTTRSGSDQCLFVLGTADDTEQAWLRAGQALERAWLEITRAKFVASVFTQPIEVGPIRVELRDELRLDVHPHLILRVGKAAATPATMRRAVAEVLVEQSG